jgi:hypothetical protein
MNLLNICYNNLDEESDCHKASTYTRQQNTEKCGHTSVPQVRFKLIILVFEQSKAVQASDCMVIVILQTVTYTDCIKTLNKKLM